MAYRGYLIVALLRGGFAISKDGFHIAYARDIQDARQIIDSLID